MQSYFNIALEFNRASVHHTIKEIILAKRKGYVCVVDGNVLATACKDKEYQRIINNALINTCDGSSIALLAGIIHRKKCQTYTGPELFTDYTQKNYKQYFLGNTTENLVRLKNEFKKLNYPVELFKFEALPFLPVEDFNYTEIAGKINKFKPDIIWVSLGAPKQEIFISKLFPYINQGILFAIGAAFNLFLADNDNKRAPVWMRKIHLEWLYRVCKSPDRIGKRAFNYFILLPKLILSEIKNKHKQ